MTNQLTAFEMFRGYGGFTQACIELGIKLVADCEKDKWANKFCDQAFENKGVIHFDDATKIDTRELPQFDVLIAGFPCQAFSNAGKRRGFEDTRGTLFFDVLRVLNDKRPKYFLLENVKGLLTHELGKTMQTILRCLTDLGYTVETALLSSEHFGLPQKRGRIFIFGYLGKESTTKIFPDIQAKNIIYERDSKTQNEGQRIFATVSTKVDRTESNYIIESYISDEDFELLQQGLLPEEKIINLKIRRLTPLECFRLQGFPDEVFYKGSPGISDAQLYKGAGNAVTVNVVREVLKQIIKLNESRVSNEQ